MCSVRLDVHRDLGIRLALAAIGLVGCTSEASLHVDVTHDPTVAALVKSGTLSIYVKAGLTCGDVEFGDATDDQLAGALAVEAALDAPLNGIPRTDPKVIVARGYDAGGTLVDAGCVEYGEITGDATVALTTVPAATVAISVNTADQRGLIVATTDASNASIDGRAVSWRLFGAAGTTADSARYHVISDGVWEPKQPTCTTNGDAQIHPMPPLLPGGFALQLRVGWPTVRPPLFSSFTPIDSATSDVSTIVGEDLVAPCALERRGTATTIACMASPTTVALYHYDVAGRALTKASTQVLPALGSNDSHYAGVVAIDEANGDRDVYAISNLGAWVPIDGAPAANASSSWCGSQMLRCDNYETVALAMMPACGDSPAQLIAQSTDTPVTGGPIHLRTMPVRGGAPSEYSVKDGTLVGAGCVTELQPDGTSKQRQAAVIGIAKTASTPAFEAAVFPCSATKSPCTVALPSQQNVSFVSIGGEAQLAATVFDATGAQVARYVFDPAEGKGGAIGNKDRLIERGRQVAAAAPLQLVAGRFDADSDPDLLWTFTTQRDVEFQIAYAREALGAPLSALAQFATATGLVPKPTQLFAADFNGDGFDELVFVFETTVPVLNSTLTTLAVVPTGVPYANPPTPPDDPACAP